MKSEDEPGRIVGRVVGAVPPLGVQVDDLSANVAAALKVFVGLGLVALTMFLAVDFGGVLPWSRWAAVTAVLWIGAVALPIVGLAYRGVGGGGVTRGAIAIPLLCMIVWGLAYVQTLPLPAGWVRWLSPGSAEAYGAWVPDEIRQAMVGEPGLIGQIARGRHPISVSANLTRGVLIAPVLFGVVCLVSAFVFRSGRSVVWLLAGIATCGGIIAFLGISDQLRVPIDGELEMVITYKAGAPFGPFVCRNNGAGYMNLTLAASIGLLVYALLRQWEQTDRLIIQPGSNGRWPDGRLHRLWLAIQQTDPLSAISAVLVFLSMSGVLASRSRGGILAAVVGAVVASLFSGGRGARLWLFVLIVGVMGAVVGLLGSIGLLESITERLETLRPGSGASVARVTHWSDCVEVVQRYLPMGAGLGAHRYAYLPYQKIGGPLWYVNADNLYVEWLVEGGVWLISLLMIGIAIFMLRLRVLTQAVSQPHITALIAMGWFILGSQAVSQFFDFGMLMPGIYLTLAVLVGATFGVKEESDDEVVTSRLAARLGLGARGWSVAAFATLAAVALGLGYFQTEQDSVDHYRTSALAISKWSGQRVDPETVALAEWSEGSRNPELLSAVARAGMRLEAAAGEDAAAQTDGGDFGTTELEATISARRAMYYLDAEQRGAPPESVLFVGQSKERLLRARGYAMRALMLCPLHDLARYSLLETGFLAGESKETSESLIRQWAKLRSRNADVSQIIARIAVIHPRGEVARQMVRQVTDLAPGREVLFWPMIQLLGGEQSLEEVLPDNAESILQAIEALRLEGEIRQRLLTRADGLIQAGLKGQENTLKGADFAALASRLALARQNRAEAEAWLFKAIIWAPRNAQHRYRFVTLLEENGEFEKARQQLEICLKWEPENRVFIARRESLLEKLEATKKQR